MYYRFTILLFLNMKIYERFFSLKEELVGEYWIDKDGNSTYADGDIGDSNHASIVIDRVMRDILDIFDAEHPSLYDDALDESEFYESIHDALELSEELEQMWEDGDWQGVMTLKLPPDFDKKRFGKMMDVMNGTLDATSFGKQYYGWIRLKANQVDLWEITESSLRALSEGIYSAYGEDSFDENFDIEVEFPRRLYITKVPYFDIETHNVQTVLSHKI